MTSNKLLVLIGSGPGIGVATASLFANKGFSVALFSRSADRLKGDAAKSRKPPQGIPESRPSPSTPLTTPPSNPPSSKSTNPLARPRSSSTTPRVGTSTFGEFTPEEMLQDYKLNAIGVYVTAVWALLYLPESAQQGGRPSFLLSGSGIGYMPFAPFFSLSTQKAAQNKLPAEL